MLHCMCLFLIFCSFIELPATTRDLRFPRMFKELTQVWCHRMSTCWYLLGRNTLKLTSQGTSFSRATRPPPGPSKIWSRGPVISKWDPCQGDTEKIARLERLDVSWQAYRHPRISASLSLLHLLIAVLQPHCHIFSPELCNYIQLPMPSHVVAANLLHGISVGIRKLTLEYERRNCEPLIEHLWHTFPPLLSVPESSSKAAQMQTRRRLAVNIKESMLTCSYQSGHMPHRLMAKTRSTMK